MAVKLLKLENMNAVLCISYSTMVQRIIVNTLLNKRQAIITPPPCQP
jgi:hypothetical protein